MPRVRGGETVRGAGAARAGRVGRVRGSDDGPRRREPDVRVAGGASERDLSPEQFAEVQRARLLAGAAAAIDEVGYERATVAHITARARISRRTFYELFEDREACMAALIEEAIGRLEGELAHAGIGGLPWRERIRGGLLVILRFLDREPALARISVVEGMRGGRSVLELRERVLARLTDAIDEGRALSARAEVCTPLVAEGLVGATLAIVHRRLLGGAREPLTGLLGELTGMILLPYLGPGAARREQARPAPADPARSAREPRADGDPLQEVRMRLTYRTMRVLEGVGERPGVSNRAIGDHAGVADAGQISKLLARLERLGLVLNTAVGHAKGEPNAWQLTPLGREVVRRLAPARPHAFDEHGIAEPSTNGQRAAATTQARTEGHSALKLNKGRNDVCS